MTCVAKLPTSKAPQGYNTFQMYLSSSGFGNTFDKIVNQLEKSSPPLRSDPDAPVTMSSGEESFTSASSHDDAPAFCVIKYSNEDSSFEPDDEADPKLFLTEGELCFGCGRQIRERYLLKVSGRTWHVACLRCCQCHVVLERQSSCFVKEDNIYCKLDYARSFGTKCSKCLRSIQSTDWVRRAKQNVYHLACFACESCKRQLSTGEEFALQEGKVLCKTHYIEVIEGGPSTDSDSQSKSKAKRVRTTFTEEQLQVLQANFQLDSNPDGQDLERIAQITGLSKRVTQVWFQNSRARQKKHQQQHPGTSPSSSMDILHSSRLSSTPSPGEFSLTVWT